MFEAKRATEESHASELEATSASPREVDEASLTELASRGLQQTQQVPRLAYTRRQAAEALGVSISTIDRYVVPAVETVKLPWGQRLILAEGIERLLNDYREHARGRPARRAAGRPVTLPRSVVERIRLEYARGRGLSEIARALTAEGVSTAHGGRKWWPSTVRAVLVRSSSQVRRWSTSPESLAFERGFRECDHSRPESCVGEYETSPTRASVVRRVANLTATIRALSLPRA